MKNFLILLILVSIVACESKVETRYLDVRALSASELYSSDSVFAYLNRYKNENKALADAYQEKAEKQKDNLDKMVYYLKRSISLLPNLEKYKQLAAILSKLEHFDELNELYYLINYTHYLPVSDQKKESIYLFGKPDEDMVYEGLFTSIARWNCITGEDLYLAEEFGYDREKLKRRLLSDSRITMDKNSAAFKKILLQFLPYEHLDSIARLPESFQNFLTSIHDTSNQFQIDAKLVSEFNYENFNGMNDGGEMMMIGQEALDEFYLKEKRENKKQWFQFNFNHFYKAFPSVNVVVYALDTSARACPREMRHVYHRLVTYNDEGDILDSKIIALQSAEDQKIALVNKTKITIEEAKRTWKKPYNKNEFDNRVTETIFVGTENYEILEDGSIQQLVSLELAQ